MPRARADWPTRRIVALCFTALLFLLCINLFLILGFSQPYILTFFSVIAVLGALYVYWGADPPPLFYRIARWSSYIGGAEVEPDNSPGHLPYKVVIPLLLLTVLIAAALTVHSVFFAGP